jgi:hypothetical protein
MTKQSSIVLANVLAAMTLLAGMSAAMAAPPENGKMAPPPAASTNTKTAPQANTKTAPQASDTLSLNAQQQTKAWHDLYMPSLNQKTPPGFNASVGATMPSSIVTAPVTAKAASDVPELKPYRFAMVQKKLVIVNPSDQKIADVITR